LIILYCFFLYLYLHIFCLPAVFPIDRTKENIQTRIEEEQEEEKRQIEKKPSEKMERTKERNLLNE
jgi:hypothetical protein